MVPSRDTLPTEATSPANQDRSLGTKEYYGRKEAARILTHRGIPTAPATLAKLATTGGGPEMSKFGRRVFYTRMSLDSWIASRLWTCHSSSDLPRRLTGK